MKITWEDYIELKKKYAKNRIILGTKKVSSSRFRDLKEREIISRMDRNRWQKWSEEGTLVKLGKRKYRLAI